MNPSPRDKSRGREICAFRARARRHGKTRKQQRPANRRKAISDSQRG